MNPSSRKILSIIVPVFNEGDNVITAYRIINSEISKLPELNSEIIFVDDGSHDDTFSYLLKIASENQDVKALKLSTNCGPHMAIRAGLSYAKGDYACFLACDLQEPPALIKEMLSKLKDPYEIIWAVRNSRKDGFFTKLYASIFYLMARIIVSKNIPPSGAGTFLISTKVLKTLKHYDERNLTLEGLFATMGFKNNYIYYDREKRKSGRSKWNLSKRVKLFIDFFVAYSYTPIRFISGFGILMAAFGLAWTVYIVLQQLLHHNILYGWASIISILLVGFGFTNISLGIIAEYLWRTLDESRKRPKYIIEKSINLDL